MRAGRDHADRGMGMYVIGDMCEMRWMRIADEDLMLIGGRMGCRIRCLSI